MLTSRVLRAGAALCALATVFAAAPAFAAPAAPVPAAASQQRISVEVVGSGPDVVLIPGLATSREVWRPLAAELAKTHRLHLVQISGFAGQPAPAGSEPVVVAPAAEEIAAYIRSAGLKQPAVIGHSLGGAAGLMLAERHPELVGRLMVVDALPFYSAMFGPGATVEGAKPFADQAYAQVVGADAASFAAGQQRTAAGLVKDPATRAKVVEWSLASDRVTLASAVRELMTTDLRPDLVKVRAPVTVLYAWDEASGLPVAAVDGLFKGEWAGVKGVQMVRVDGSLHFIMADQPAKFAAEVERFLK
ncbi:alpha/beta hydrolase [Caulobacter sp. 17J65-9]|uniref:alpha/beta fold hydrolase n=1 Tax=Caulobacter sp. 17J65-9 TaxID=2709382 RepID=UPI0013CCAC1B|nr:alpha/beta hydrolase [Caulobacter sp. 17J65-9]NEX94224.1 alpha/beta hydrolase [Caulobacter sp. 17J65-9]